MAPILAALGKFGLSLVAKAAVVKGQKWVEEKTGINLTEDPAPEDLTKLQQWQLENETELQQIALQHDKLAVENAKDVNDTMRDEAKSERWPQYSWRPAIGFAVAGVTASAGITILTAYIGAMFFGKVEALQHVPGMIGALAALLAVVTPILGIASWHRGKKQVEEAKA